MRQHFEITMTFTYNNGDTSGVLRTTVNSRKAVDAQLEANRAWLAAKGHTPNAVEVKPVDPNN